MMTKIKTDAEIQAMREGGKMLATVLQALKNNIKSGMTTKDLADIAAKDLKRLGGKPAFLGYEGFPDVLCVSVNSQVVHGIPSKKKIIKDGDVVGLDFGVLHKGMVTDGAITVIVNKPANPRVSQLVSKTEQALLRGIDALRGGIKVGDVASVIQQVLDNNKLGIVRDFVGHGVGHELHEEPNIPNFGSAGTGPILKAGMTIAIEPMATLGGDGVYVDRDNWTVRTKDKSLSAHFEHTVLVTPGGAEILTQI